MHWVVSLVGQMDPKMVGCSAAKKVSMTAMSLAMSLDPGMVAQ